MAIKISGFDQLLYATLFFPFLQFVSQTGSEGASGPSCSHASSSVALSACRKRVKIVTVKFNEFPNYSMLNLQIITKV